jgi:hypothetical protein
MKENGVIKELGKNQEKVVISDPRRRECQEGRKGHEF